jgi:pimeloyl-ACP methyl ester carboxylesterase
VRVLLSAALAVLFPLSLAAQSPAGLWEGSITTPGAPLNVIIRLNEGPGGWTGTIDIPAQGAKGLPLSDIGVDGSTVRFTLAVPPQPPAAFNGTVSADGSSIAGQFMQAQARLPFALKRNASGVVVRKPRPQEPQPPLPYDAQEVSIESVDGVRLAGTLTTPRAAGRHPAVVLISGSGAQDRDETVYDHKPFLVLADHLTRQGIAVLRYDDRGFGGSTGSVAAATTEDFAADAGRALEWLKDRSEVDASRIGLIGHSEGGLIAAMVASRSADVNFLVLLATSGVVGETLLYQQAAALGRAMGAPEDQLAKARAMQEQLYAIVKSETDLELMRTRIRALAGDGPADVLTSPWFRFFLTYDPAKALGAVKVPALALNGEQDLQVPFKENLAAIQAAFASGGNRDVTVRSFPALNHLFQTSKTGHPMEYGAIEETFAPAVLDVVSAWILERVR